MPTALTRRSKCRLPLYLLIIISGLQDRDTQNVFNLTNQNQNQKIQILLNSINKHFLILIVVQIKGIRCRQICDKVIKVKTT